MTKKGKGVGSTSGTSGPPRTNRARSTPRRPYADGGTDMRADISGQRIEPAATNRPARRADVVHKRPPAPAERYYRTHPSGTGRRLHMRGGWRGRACQGPCARKSPWPQFIDAREAIDVHHGGRP